MSETEQISDPGNAAIDAMAQVSEALARIERERARVRPEDWATLLRQIQDVLYELLTHPFIQGDLEAEYRLEQVIYTTDLEEMDQRVDHFANYVIGKLQYNAALKAEAEGKSEEQVPRYTAPSNSTTEVTRAQAVNGPSGSDFQVQDKDKSEEPPSARRSVLRL